MNLFAKAAYEAWMATHGQSNADFNALSQSDQTRWEIVAAAVLNADRGTVTISHIAPSTPALMELRRTIRGLEWVENTPRA